MTENLETRLRAWGHEFDAAADEHRTTMHQIAATEPSSTPSIPGHRAFRRVAAGPGRSAHLRPRLLATAAAVVVFACGMAAIALSRSGNEVTTSSESQADDSVPVTDGDAEAYDLINSMFALTPYGAEGDRFQFMILEHKRHECMTEAGFEYHQYPFNDPGPPDQHGLALVPPLPADADVRARGYEAFRYVSADPTTDEYRDAEAANEALADANPEWDTTLNGDRDTTFGCLGAAEEFLRDRVGLEAIDEYRALSDEWGPILNLEESDEEPIRSAREAWVACIAPKGFDYQSPAYALFDFYRNPGTEPTASEINVALADLECQQSTNYRTIYLGMLASGVETWLAENEGAVTELRETIEQETLELRELAHELGLA